jgi:hypothetical protein
MTRRAAPHAAARRTGAPVGRVTRPKTAPERLRRTDVLAALLGVPPLDAPVAVDLGFGATPVTTLEMAQRLAPLVPGLRVIGVEIDAARVAASQPLARAGIEFRVGGFELPVDEPIGWLRVMNVLRQYEEMEHAPAIAQLAARLAPGGMLIEGTSSPTGRILTANLYARERDGAFGGDPRWRGLVLSVNLRRPWEPREVQTRLPKNLIHHCAPGSALDRFFETWQRCHTARLRHAATPAARFSAVAAELAAAGYFVERGPALLRRGFLLLRSIPE